jgi:predicted DNA-binding ribbon-helix-helix protein
MSRQAVAQTSTLIESPWWTRLAAFSENRETSSAATVAKPEQEPSRLVKALASLYRPNQVNGWISFLVKTN